jgi:hypothetical protein
VSGKKPSGRTLDAFKNAHDPNIKIAKLEAELKQALSESADAAAIKTLVGTALSALDQYEPPQWTVTPQKQSSSPGVPTLFFSDFHWGEIVRGSQIGGVNSFNLAIGRQRLQKTVETAIELCGILDPQMRYPGIVVPLGGDMVSGNIHEELQATNELNTMPTVLDLHDWLKVAINRLAEAFGRVFLPCVTGNHGRDTRKTWAKDRTHTSFDWLLYQFLARSFKDDPRVTFFIPDGSDALYRIFGTRYNLTHGDQFKAGDSIIGPIGPLMRGNQKKTARNQAINQEYDVLLAGHWHQYIHLSRLIVNGSLKGYDEYASQGNFGFEPPTQALWVTHPKFGITFRMPVYCSTPKAEPRAGWAEVPK